MMKKSVLFLILSLLALAVLPLGASVQAQDTVTTLNGTINNGSGCRLYEGTWWPYDVRTFTAMMSGPHMFAYVSHTWDGDLYAVVTANSYSPVVEPASQDLVGEFSSSGPTAITVNLTAGTTYFVSVDNDQEGFGDVDPTFASASFASELACQERRSTDSGDYTITVTPPTALPECGLSLPPDAAVGTFTDWADLYWMPGEKLYPPLSMEPGQSLWVVGQDESGMYKKVVLSCQYLWVEAAIIGPNYDETWNGAQLPTTVVD